MLHSLPASQSCSPIQIQIPTMSQLACYNTGWENLPLCRIKWITLGDDVDSVEVVGIRSTRRHELLSVQNASSAGQLKDTWRALWLLLANTHCHLSFEPANQVRDVVEMAEPCLLIVAKCFYNLRGDGGSRQGFGRSILGRMAFRVRSVAFLKMRTPIH